MPSNNVKATVFIPTFNGEEFIGDILRALSRQKCDFAFEVLIIDSGSSDTTLDIVGRYLKKMKNLRLHTIPNSEFGHGKTRNLAAKMAKGEYVVYLSHDAVPAHDRWLREMVRPFTLNAGIKGVFGRQIPRPNCCPLIKRDVRDAFRSLGPEYGIVLCQQNDTIHDPGLKAAAGFYSDVNSALPRSFNQQEMPYREIDYAEDQAYGKDLIERGYIKAYTPFGAVLHSNSMGPREYKKRIFDEYIGLRRAGHTVTVPPLGFCVREALRGTLRDMLFILRDRDYSRKRKLYWFAVSPLYHVYRWQSVRKAAKIDVEDAGALAKNSLEYRQRKQAQQKENKI